MWTELKTNKSSVSTLNFTLNAGLNAEKCLFQTERFYIVKL